MLTILYAVVGPEEVPQWAASLIVILEAFALGYWLGLCRGHWRAGNDDAC